MDTEQYKSDTSFQVCVCDKEQSYAINNVHAPCF